MAKKKTAGKTAGGVPFAKGPDPRRGVGLPGRSGRKPSEFVAECSRLTDDEVLPKVERYLRGKADPSDPAWRWCASYVTDLSKPKPATDAKVNLTPVSPIRIYEMPSNGRERGPGPADDPPRSRMARPAARPAPQNGGGDVILPNGKRAYRWRDGTLRSFREPED
jgi:hypothetical protein